jgi:hypothetical protein
LRTLPAEIADLRQHGGRAWSAFVPLAALCAAVWRAARARRCPRAMNLRSGGRWAASNEFKVAPPAHPPKKCVPVARRSGSPCWLRRKPCGASQRHLGSSSLARSALPSSSQ